MALKKPSQQANKLRRTANPGEADALANKLADKPYGDEAQHQPETEEQVRTSISLPKSLFHTIEDMARDNKRQGIEPKSVSAIVRNALNLLLNHTS